VNVPPVIPDHTLLRPIGRGAYGEVWLARNVMGTLRAVKIIWRRQFDSQRPYDREFSGIQRYEPVSHSSGGLVHVLHVGRNEAEGYFYYVMELADPAGSTESEEPLPNQSTESARTGDVPDYEPRTLRSDLKRVGRLPTADCLRLALDLVSGLAQLHRRGLVHRDVKPGNVIYVHGRAKLADIGLVSAHGEGRTFVGTEGYIPPEGPGSPTADIYALGIALYEASTGYSPEKFPDMPPEWFAESESSEALELHEIILKACEGQRLNRYETAESMQADLALLQSGQSVRRVRALERRFARLRLSGAIVTVLLACALLIAFFANYRARLAAESRAKETRLREQAQSSLARAESAERDARQQLYTALFEQARAKVRSGELGQRVNSLEALKRAGAISNSAALRGVVLAALALPDLRLERELPLAADNTLAEFDPAFERIATARGPGAVEIHAVSDQRLLATLPASTNLMAYGARWSHDGKFIAVGRDLVESQARDWEVWDAESARCLFLLRRVSGTALAFHPRTNEILAAFENSIEIRDVENDAILNRLKLDAIPIQLILSPEGTRFAVVQRAGKLWKVAVHDRVSGGLLVSRDFADAPGNISWHPGERWIGVPDFSGQVSLLDSQTGEIRGLGRHKAQAVFNTFSCDGTYLLSGGWERELICWDMGTMRHAFTAGLNSFVAQFSPDGGRCAVITRTPSVQLCAFERPTVQHEFAEDLGPRVLEAAFSSDGRWLAASGADRLAVWDLHHGGPAVLATNAGQTRLEFSQNGELFANRRGACFRWHLSPGRNDDLPPELQPLEILVPPALVSVCLISNGLAFSGARGSMLMGLDQPISGQGEWKRTIGGLNEVSPDGRWLAMFRSFTSQLYVYRLPVLDRVAVLEHSSNISGFQFSPTSDEVAVACRNGVEFWSTSRWQRTRVIPNFNHVLYSPDGRTVWLSADFRAACLYDARTITPLLPLPGGTIPLAVSRDGRRLAVSLDGRRLQLWDLVVARAQLARLELDWGE
jgi:WD40 repeat protein